MLMFSDQRERRQASCGVCAHGCSGNDLVQSYTFFLLQKKKAYTFFLEFKIGLIWTREEGNLSDTSVWAPSRNMSCLAGICLAFSSRHVPAPCIMNWHPIINLLRAVVTGRQLAPLYSKQPPGNHLVTLNYYTREKIVKSRNQSRDFR